MLKISQTANSTTLWQFKMVVNTGDIRYLLILDNYDELPIHDAEELLTVWQSIYQEWSDLIGGNQSDLWLVKTKILTVLKLNFERHSSLFRIIKEYPHEDVITLANEDGYMITLEDFDKTFEKAYTKLMRMNTQINILQKEKEEFGEDEQEDFDMLIIVLSKHQGYQFNEHEMTVKQFANIYKTYKDAEAA